MWTSLKGYWSKFQFQSNFGTKPEEDRSDWTPKALKLTIRDGPDSWSSLYIDARAIITVMLIPVIYLLAGETGNQWFYLLAAALISALLLGFLLPLLQILDVSLHYTLPISAMARDSVQLKITLYRKSRNAFWSAVFPLKWLLVRANLVNNNGKSSLLKPMAIEYVGSEAWVFVSTGALSRGVYRLKGLEVYSCFPFGLFWWERSFETDDPQDDSPLLTVFPQIVAIEGNFL
ncbi:MAG TPA: hypothetical protein V6C72_14265, partial [Chroococcales cyanobacterium]